MIATERPAVSLLSLLPAIAAALPGQWTSKPQTYDGVPVDDRGELIRADGLTIYANANAYGNRGKLALHHSRPTGKDRRGVTLWEPNAGGQIASPSINCTLTKSAEQIAGDIARRMLSECERIDALARAKIAEYENAENAQLETLRQLSKATGLSDIPRQWKGTEPRFNLNFKGPNGDGTAEIRGGDCVCVEMRSLTRAQALSLMEWIKGNA